MRTLSHSWLWTEPWVTPRSCTSPAFSGISHLKSMGAPTHRHVHSAWHKTLHSRHPAMTVTSHLSEQPKWNKDLKCFFFFPSSSKGSEDEARQLRSKAGFSLPHNYGIQWIEEKNCIWSTHCVRTKILLRHRTETLSSFCSLKLSAFPIRYIKICAAEMTVKFNVVQSPGTTVSPVISILTELFSLTSSPASNCSA